MKLFNLFIICFLCSFYSYSQILIGYHEDDIVEYVEEKYPEFMLSTGSFSGTTNAVKFESQDGEKTLMFFLNDENICQYSKLMLDIDVFDQTVSTLNKKYKNIGENKWLTVKEGKEYVLSIEKTSWMFSIVTQKKK